MPAIEPAPAATILLVRDAPGLEVLMVTRHHQIDFASGALVFPGGKRAPEDGEMEWAAWSDAPADLSEAERALRIAAVREAFEESGVLLARLARERGVGAPFASAADCAALAEMRDAVAEGRAPFLPLIREAGLVLALDAVVPFARWITPIALPKRFDTYFYIARAPDDHVMACDGREAVEAVWIAPAQALEEGKQGARLVMFPTRLNLERLAESPDAASAIAASRARPVFTVLPRIEEEDGRRVLRIPAEAGYACSYEDFDGRN